MSLLRDLVINEVCYEARITGPTGARTRDRGTGLIQLSAPVFFDPAQDPGSMQILFRGPGPDTGC